MKLPGFLSSALILRRTVKALERVELALSEQNRLIARIADHLAPQLPEQAAASASVDFADRDEMALVLEFVEQTTADVGRPPTEEEILRYLALEKTVELQWDQIAKDRGVSR